MTLKKLKSKDDITVQQSMKGCLGLHTKYEMKSDNAQTIQQTS